MHGFREAGGAGVDSGWWHVVAAAVFKDSSCGIPFSAGAVRAALSTIGAVRLPILKVGARNRINHLAGGKGSAVESRAFRFETHRFPL